MHAARHLTHGGHGRGCLTGLETQTRSGASERPYADAVTSLEFTVEPFVEGSPGPHVRAAVAAVESLGPTVEFGPFGSTCEAAAAAMPDLVAAVVRAALDNGATHVSLHVSEPTR